ncbi:MAG TPA: cupredoxin family copper-binding protein [Thermoleophilaceae bacterium]|jgi:LPXTG-motif cell wall-anchored protein|nr:cupredoxin family copper-binding protein [Thermoleophilaceae bacterium]
MRHLALLVAVYALIAALVVPGSLLAQESEEPAPTETAAAEQAAPEPEPELAPAPAAAPEPAPPAPEPQVLADERETAPKPKPKPKPTALAAASGSVTIVDFDFSPGTITVGVGDTVTWVNNGPTPHSATSSNGAFDTGIFPAGESRSHTFNEAGTFSYICTPHPNMRGTVVVQGAQTGGGDTPDSSGGSGESAGTGATGEAAQSDGPTLPNSGADSGALLILGGLLLLLGAAVHRRVRTG